MYTRVVTVHGVTFPPPLGFTISEMKVKVPSDRRFMAADDVGIYGPTRNDRPS